VYRLKAHEIPMKERTARGTAVVNLLPLQPDEKIQAIIDTRDYESNKFLFFCTKNGQVKKTKFTEYDSSLRAGIIAINLKDGDELVRVIPTNGGDDILVVTKAGQAIRFAEDEVRAMGRAAAGVRGMKMRVGDEVVSCDVTRDDAAILLVTDGGYGKRTQLDKFNRQGRGGQGVRGIKINEKKGSVVAAFMVGIDDEIFVINSVGTVIRMEVREISSQGRDATGVKVMNVADGETVASVAPVLGTDDDNTAAIAVPITSPTDSSSPILPSAQRIGPVIHSRGVRHVSIWLSSIRLSPMWLNTKWFRAALSTRGGSDRSDGGARSCHRDAYGATCGAPWPPG
jgi:DNA gyrase subunit A